MKTLPRFRITLGMAVRMSAGAIMAGYWNDPEETDCVLRGRCLLIEYLDRVDNDGCI